VVFSFRLSGLSPLFIFVGVGAVHRPPVHPVGRFGRVLIGLGLMLLALRLVADSTAIMVQSPAIKALLLSLSSDVLLEITVGCRRLAGGLFQPRHRAAHRHAGRLRRPAPDVAMGITLGANLGSGVLGVLATANRRSKCGRCPWATWCSRSWACCCARPFVGLWLRYARPLLGDPATVVVLFHLTFNLVMAFIFIGLTKVVARQVETWLPKAPKHMVAGRPHHLDPSALATPSLAISCAAREALHQADVVETMMLGMLRVIKDNDLRLAEELRKLDDDVDQLYSAIKYYLTKISREALGEEESRRWTDIISFTINMEQIGDIIERILIDIEDKKIRKSRNFSDAGMAEICELHARLVDNLRLGMSVFLNGSVRDAQKLLEEKARFRELEAGLCRHPPHAPDREHGAEHRDQLAAPGPDQRPEADQLPHLLHRLSHPRIGGRARAQPHQAAASGCAFRGSLGSARRRQ
jgi:phosphate:Na+ symporter